MWRRPKLVRQNDGNDCGPAALATLALHHGQDVGLEKLRDLTATDRTGANLLSLVRTARSLGFSAKAIRCTADALPQLPMPAIAHLRDDEGFGHFVVVYGVKRGKVIVGDPAAEIDKRSLEQFTAQWTGNLLVAVPDPTTPLPRSHGQRRSAWRRFLHLLRPHTAILLEVMLCALLMTLLATSTSLFVQHLVDSVLVHREGTLLNALGIGMVMVVVLKTLFGVVRQYLLAHIARRLDLGLIGAYSRHLLQLPVKFFETRRIGEIFSRVTDAAKLREAINGTTTTAVVDAIVVVVLLAVLWMYDLPLAIAATLVAPLFVAVVALNHPAAARHSRSAMEHAAQAAAHLVEDISGVDTIKAFNAEDRRTEQFEGRFVAFTQAVFSLQKLDIRMNAAGMFITSLASVGMLWLGGQRVLAGALTIGELLFVFMLLTTLLEPLNRLATVNLKIQDALVAIDRLFQVLDLEAEPRGDNRVPFKQLTRELELRNVTFSYGTRGNVLDDVTLHVPAGKTVAIVGESGCGKSTLLKLLLRFHQPNQGQILLDGTDLRDFDLATVRDRFGMVTQDTFVFDATIRENISLGAPQASLADVVAAARAAGLDEFINGLPQRYDTIVGERGANLSGGQRQRLAIARALVNRPDVLVFDEATSQLDTTTERHIQDNLRIALAGQTVILVAHRLSTVRDADLIYVLDKGRVAEQGTHQHLLAAGGHYAGLWRSQMSIHDHGDLPGSPDGLHLPTNRIALVLNEG